jgi:glycosyltransferase involved in cell wall biosynthesis
MSKITIIIPFFNPGDKIMNSLESLNNQKDKNFTAIFINDGSTDNSLDILQDELKKSTFNYTIINQRNKGVSAARNKGIDLVKTEYLMFLDSDDILSKDAIKLLNNNVAGNIDLLYW